MHRGLNTNLNGIVCAVYCFYKISLVNVGLRLPTLLKRFKNLNAVGSPYIIINLKFMQYFRVYKVNHS